MERKSTHQEQSFTELLRQRKVIFPYKSYTYTDPKVFWNNLLKYSYVLQKEKYQALGCTDSEEFPLTYQGEMCYFAYNPTSYEDIDIITDLFTEEQRVKARAKKEAMSPFDYFQKNAGKLITILRKNGEEITAHNLRELLYTSVKEATQFKVTIAYSVYKLFDAKNILDMSAGWGDRLIAAIASGAKYTGYDPNHTLRDGHNKIIRTFGNTTDHKVFYSPFEKSKIEGKFDLAFTSPPFFDLEIYTKAPGQSITSYPIYGDWLRNFFYVMLQKAWDALEINGRLVVYVSDISGKYMTMEMNHYLKTIPDARYEGMIGVEGAHKRVFPLWIWRKIDPIVNNTNMSLNQSF